MPQLVKNGKLVRDHWRLYTQAAPDYTEQCIVPLDALTEDTKGVWLESDVEIELIIDVLLPLECVAIDFPTFADGRGLTMAKLLRERYRYKGEIRAVGNVLPDWTPFMLRSGFDAFVLADQKAARTAIACMETISENYQSSVAEPLPKFRRQSEPKH